MTTTADANGIAATDTLLIEAIAASVVNNTVSGASRAALMFQGQMIFFYVATTGMPMVQILK